MGDRRLEARHMFAGAFRRDVAAIGEGVDGNRNAGIAHMAGKSNDMILMRMHATRRDQTHQMKSAAGGRQDRTELAQFLALVQIAVGNGPVNTG